MTKFIKRPLPAHFLIGAFILGASVLVMLGCYSRTALLIQIHPDLVSMHFNTALGFVLLGAALTSLSFRFAQASRILSSFLSGLFAGLVALLGAVTLTQYLTGRDLGIDGFFMDPYLTPHSPYPGRMAANTAACFLLAGLALLTPLIARIHARAYLVTTLFGGLVLAIGLIAFLSYVTGHETVYGSVHYTQMAIHTAIGFIFTGTALLLLTKPFWCNISLRRYQLSAWGITVVLAIFAFLDITIHSAEQTPYRNVIKADMDILATELNQKLTHLAFLQNGVIEVTDQGGAVLFRPRDGAPPASSLAQRQTTAFFRLNRALTLQAAPEFYSFHKVPVQWPLVFMVLVSLLFLFWLTRQYFKGQEQEQWGSSLYQRQSAALDTMLDGLFVISDQGVIQEVNQAALKMFGYKRDELLGEKINCLTPEPHYSDHADYLQRYRETGEKHIIGEKQYLDARRKDGGIFPMVLEVTEGRTRDGVFFTGVIHDLTEQVAVAKEMAEKDTLLKLAQKDAWLKMAVQDSSAGLALQDTTGRFIEVNPAFRDWLGYSNEEMLALSDRDIVGESDLFVIKNTMNKMLSGEMSAAHHERQYKRKDGRYIWCMVSATVVRNEEGEIEFIASHIINIEQEKRLGIELKDAQSFQKLITDNNPDLVYVKDADSRLVFANPAFFDIFPDNEINQVIDTMPNEQFNQEEIDAIQAQSRKAFAEGQAEMIQKVKDSNGNPRILLNTKTRFENASGKPFILGVARDVTAQETLIAQLEKSNRDLDQFAYVASHDLKSPLNAIQKIATWLEDDCEDILPESSKEHLSLLKSRSQRMSRLLTDLLTYSRVGRYAYKDERVNLKNITADVFELLDAPEAFICEGQDVELAFPRIPLEIILRNLVSNAIKHHDKPGGRIRVTYELTPTSHMIEVWDDGPGIPPELHKKATDMFQTLKSRDQVEGSGMGLAMVKKIIEHYDGRLDINSDGARETAMNIHWPIRNNTGTET